MGFLKKKQTVEYQRTCSRCGNVWFVTAAERKMKAPNRMQMAGVKMQAAGNRGKIVGGKKKAIAHEAQLARLQADRDRVEAISRCSSCGSVSFSEALA